MNVVSLILLLIILICWRHGMETLSALLELYFVMGPAESPHKGPVMLSLKLDREMLLNKKRATGDLWRHGTYVKSLYGAQLMLSGITVYITHWIYSWFYLYFVLLVLCHQLLVICVIYWARFFIDASLAGALEEILKNMGKISWYLTTVRVLYQKQISRNRWVITF